MRKKLVVVGDDTCGKTSLLIVFSKDQFPTDYLPTVFENYTADIVVDGQIFELALWDTSGQEDYDRLRPLSYPETNVVLMCFSVDLPDSLKNVLDKWAPEVKHFCPNVPIILVANKIDLRQDAATISQLELRNQRPPSTSDGQAVAKKINASKYFECSAKNKEGIQAIFQHSVRALYHGKKRKPMCVLL